MSRPARPFSRRRTTLPFRDKWEFRWPWRRRHWCCLIPLGAAAIFFVLPRVSTGYLSAYTPTGEIATGFSDRVQLGRIGEIQQSSSVVMHIQIDGDSQGHTT